MTFIVAGITSDDRVFTFSDGLSIDKDDKDNEIRRHTDTKKYDTFEEYNAVVVLASSHMPYYQRFCEQVKKKTRSIKTIRQLANLYARELKNWQKEGSRFQILVAGYDKKPELYFFSNGDKHKRPYKVSYELGGFQYEVRYLFDNLYLRGSIPNKESLLEKSKEAMRMTEDLHEYVGGTWTVFEISEKGLKKHMFIPKTGNILPV